jgi:hypothetical protein
MSPFSKPVIVSLVAGTSFFAGLAVLDLRGEQMSGGELAWVAFSLAVSVSGLITTVALLRRLWWASSAVGLWIGLCMLMTVVGQLVRENPHPWPLVIAFLALVALISLRIIRAARGW